MKKVAILLQVFRDGKTKTILNVKKIDIDYYVSTYGTLLDGLRQLYSDCLHTVVSDYWVIDGVRICYDF